MTLGEVWCVANCARAHMTQELLTEALQSSVATVAIWRVCVLVGVCSHWAFGGRPLGLGERKNYRVVFLTFENFTSLNVGN